MAEAVAIPQSPGGHHHHLTLPERLLNYTAWAVAVGLFSTIGWMAMAPDDPLGAVSLTTRTQAGLMVIQVVGLAAVVSAVATILVGRRIPDAGVFAVAIGLAAANWRGETGAYILINVAQGDPAAYRAVFATFVAESFVWFFVVLVALLVSGLVTRLSVGPGDGPSPPGLGVTRNTLALSDLPIGPLAVDRDDRPSVVAGLKTAGLTVVTGLLLMALLSSADPERAVRHGQTYFTIALSFYAATLLAYEVAPARSAWWGLAAIPIAAAIGYGWTLVRAGSAAAHTPASVPPTPFARATPIEYISVGTAAVLMGFWLYRRTAHAKSLSAAAKPAAVPTPTPSSGARRKR